MIEKLTMVYKEQLSHSWRFSKINLENIMGHIMNFFKKKRSLKRGRIWPQAETSLLVFNLHLNHITEDNINIL